MVLPVNQNLQRKYVPPKKQQQRRKLNFQSVKVSLKGTEFDEDDNQSEKRVTPPPRARSDIAQKKITYDIEDSSDDHY